MIDRYTRPAMGAVWTQHNRYLAWLKVELAVCVAWHGLGRIPTAALNTIKERVRVDVDRILVLEETTKHDVIAFLTSLEEQVGPDARYIHLGCTSSDIVDTANAVQIAEAGVLLMQGLDRLLASIGTLAQRHKGTLCMGRTHGIHAEPTSFGLKMAGFYAEFTRHKARLAAALEDVRVGKLSGAVGTYAFLSPDIEAVTMRLLGLKADPHSTQIIQRDRYAHFFSTLAIMAGGVERLCVELRHLQRTEVQEVEEGFGKGQKGSSAMPHKKNPISAENMSGLARLIRTNALAAMENQALWHERDISHSSVERVILPDSTIMADYILHRLAGLLDNLVVRPERMLQNMERSFGLYYSQRILTALIDAGMPRQAAYEAVQRCAMHSFAQEMPFQNVVAEATDIGKYLSQKTLAGLFDSRYYLENEEAIFARVFCNGGECK